jgi:hypothetical protein
MKDLVSADYQSYLRRTASPAEIASLVTLYPGATDQTIQSIILASPEFAADTGHVRYSS